MTAIVSSHHQFTSCAPENSYQLMDEYELYEKGFLLHQKYKFVSTLQNGSFGKVSLAVDTEKNLKVAIKSMVKHSSNASCHTTNMFRHEIQMMNKLQGNPHIVSLIEHFNTANYHILVLEYCDDGDLYDKIVVPHSLDTARQLSIVQQMVSLVQFMHSQNVFHRDLKPENILLNRGNVVKVCDFGLATVQPYPFDLDVGTEKYIPPELISIKNYDARLADYWSLGITICFMLFGKCCFQKAHRKDDNFIGFVKDPKDWLYNYYSHHPLCSKELISILCDYLLCLNPKERDLNKFEQEFEQVMMEKMQGSAIEAAAHASVASAAVFSMDDLDLGLDDDDEAHDELADVMDLDTMDFAPSEATVSVPMVTTATAISAPSQPPSLMNSYMNSMSFSWADDDDLQTESEFLKILARDLQVINDDTWHLK